MNDIALIVKALRFAAYKHRDQRRKNIEASPYINHPIELANVLINEAGIDDVATICGALLHDTIEDTETTPQELESVFGLQICDIVMEVTDDQNLLKHERKQRQIERAAHISKQGRLVKLVDKICNVRDMASAPPAGWSEARKREYVVWAGEVVDRLRGTHAELEALFDRAIGQA